MPVCDIVECEDICILFFLDFTISISIIKISYKMHQVFVNILPKLQEDDMNSAEGENGDDSDWEVRFSPLASSTVSLG
jgi:hypothetical protein